MIDSETYVGLRFVVISPEYEKLPVCSEWPTCTFERQHGPRTKETHLSRHPFLVVTFITFECDFITRMVFFARIWNVRVSRNSWGFAVFHWKISKKDTNWSALNENLSIHSKPSVPNRMAPYKFWLQSACEFGTEASKSDKHISGSLAMDMMDVWSMAFRFSDCIFEIKIKAYLLTSLLIFLSRLLAGRYCYPFVCVSISPPLLVSLTFVKTI